MKKYIAIILSLIFVCTWTFLCVSATADTAEPTGEINNEAAEEPTERERLQDLVTTKPRYNVTTTQTAIIITTAPVVTAPQEPTEARNLADAIEAVKNGSGDYKTIVDGIANGAVDIGGTITGALGILADGANGIDYSGLFEKIGAVFDEPQTTTDVNGNTNKGSSTQGQTNIPTGEETAQALSNLVVNMAGNIGTSNGLLSPLFAPADENAQQSQTSQSGLTNIISSMSSAITQGANGATDSGSILGSVSLLPSIASIFGTQNNPSNPSVPSSSNVNILPSGSITIPAATVPSGGSYTPVTPYIGGSQTGGNVTSPTTQQAPTQLYTMAPQTTLAPVFADIPTQGGDIAPAPADNANHINAKKIIGAVIVVMAFGGAAALVIKRSL